MIMNELKGELTNLPPLVRTQSRLGHLFVLPSNHYNTIKYNTIHYNTIKYKYNTIQYNTIKYKYNTIQLNTNTIQYNTNIPYCFAIQALQCLLYWVFFDWNLCCIALSGWFSDIVVYSRIQSNVLHFLILYTMQRFYSTEDCIVLNWVCVSIFHIYWGLGFFFPFIKKCILYCTGWLSWCRIYQRLIGIFHG